MDDGGSVELPDGQEDAGVDEHHHGDGQQGVQGEQQAAEGRPHHARCRKERGKETQYLSNISSTEFLKQCTKIASQTKNEYR